MSISDNSSTIAPLSDIDGISQSPEERSDFLYENGAKDRIRKSHRARKHPDSITTFHDEHHTSEEKARDYSSVSYEKSPYADAEIVHLQVGPDAIPFVIHQTILAKSEVLNSKFDRWRMTKQHVPIPELDEVAAHTLVHYLYTGRYENLKTHAQIEKPAILNYKTSTCVYCAAIRYELAELAELAKEKITSFGEDVSISDILGIAKDYAFPVLPENETWYPNYLENTIKVSMSKDPEPFRRTNFITSVEGNSRLLQVVWKTVMSNYATATATPKLENSQNKTPTHRTTLAENVSTRKQEPEKTEIASPVAAQDVKSSVKPESVIKPEPIIEPEPTVKATKTFKNEIAVNPGPIIRSELAIITDVAAKPETPAKSEPAAKEEVASKNEVVVTSKTVVKPEATVQPKATVAAKVTPPKTSLIRSMTSSAPVEDPYKLPEIEPTVEIPQAPEPMTDELDFGRSTTYRMMGNREPKPGSQAVPDKQTERPGHKRIDSVIQVDSLVTPPSKEKVDSVEKSADPALEIVNSTEATNEAPASTKSKKKKKKAKKAAAAVVAAVAPTPEETA